MQKNDENTNGVHLMLPWPDKVLNPNVHVHWAKKNKARKTMYEAGYYLALERGVKLDPQTSYEVRMVFCPPDKRVRDFDNLIAAMKSCMDGVCRGLGIDDRNIKPLPDWGPVVKGGKVEVTISKLCEKYC